MKITDINFTTMTDKHYVRFNLRPNDAMSDPPIAYLLARPGAAPDGWREKMQSILTTKVDNSSSALNTVLHIVSGVRQTVAQADEQLYDLLEMYLGHNHGDLYRVETALDRATYFLLKKDREIEYRNATVLTIEPFSANNLSPRTFKNTYAPNGIGDIERRGFKLFTAAYPFLSAVRRDEEQSMSFEMTQQNNPLTVSAVANPIAEPSVAIEVEPESRQSRGLVCFRGKCIVQ